MAAAIEALRWVEARRTELMEVKIVIDDERVRRAALGEWEVEEEPQMSTRMRGLYKSAKGRHSVRLVRSEHYTTSTRRASYEVARRVAVAGQLGWYKVVPTRRLQATDASAREQGRYGWQVMRGDHFAADGTSTVATASDLLRMKDYVREVQAWEGTDGYDDPTTKLAANLLDDLEDRMAEGANVTTAQTGDAPKKKSNEMQRCAASGMMCINAPESQR